MKDKAWSVGLLCALAMTLAACSGDDDDDSMMAQENELGAPNPAGKPGDAQTPPTTNAEDVEAWLDDGAYENWNCEDVEHPQMKVSPHGKNRVCTNDLASGFDGEGERPVGSAAVKELYDDDSAIVGYAVEVKIKADSADGDNWFWYERVPLDSPAPHDSRGVVAEGLGSAGAAQAICVGCHAGAGSDGTHTVTGSSDFVYLQVEP